MSNKFSKVPFKYQHPITSTPPHKHLIYNKLNLLTKAPQSSLTLHFKPISATTSTDLVPHYPLNINPLSSHAHIFGCGGHSPIDPDPVKPGLYPIDFGISADLEVESKTVIDNNNVTGFTFVALGNLTVNGEQQTNLFGENGKIVYYENDAWTYSPLRYWQPGSYEFAAVMPFVGYTPSFNASNQLTLNFTNGFNLASSQTDLMVAFDSRTVQSVSSATPVKFDFEHQMSLVVIKGAYKETAGKIRVDKIEVYGNTAKTAGNMVFTHDGTKINASYSLDSQSVTDEDNVYQTIEGAWELTPSAASTEIVSGLLVFPEECDEFYIAVTYTDAYGTTNQVQTTKTSPNLEPAWERGKKYTYTFNVNLDHISFGEPTVTEWVSGGSVDTGIEM